MNKKVLILGLSSVMLLASCGGNSVNLVLRKDINFNPNSIISNTNEISLIKEQVKQGFNLLKNVKVTDREVFHNYDSANHEEVGTQEYVNKVEFFSNGSIQSSDKTIKHNNSVISKITTNNKEAIANDFKFNSTTGTDRAFPNLDKTPLSGTSKELALYTTRRDCGNEYFGVDGFFPTTQGYHSIVARLNNTKIAAYNETKVVDVLNPDGSNEPTYTQITSGYNYLEANLKGDSYIISKIEVVSQKVGNFSGNKDNYIKLNGFHKLSESSTRFEYSYNNEQSNYKDSADLNKFVSNFPAWSTSTGTLTVSTYSPIKDETGKIIGVTSVSPSTIGAYSIAHNDLHGFDVKLNGASPKYLYTFGVSATVKDYNNGTWYYTPTTPLNLTEGLTPTYIDQSTGVSYYSLNALGKIYTFNVGLAYDATAEKVTVPTFTVA